MRHVGVFVHPAVPVAVHEVLVDTAGGFVEAGVEFVEVAGARHGFGGDEDDGLAVGSEFEALESAFVGGERLFPAILHGHGEDFIVTTEHQCRVIFPHKVELGSRRRGEARHVLSSGSHEVDFGVALVLLHVVIGHRVGDLGTVGGDGLLAHLAERPHHLGGETAVLDLDFRFPYYLFDFFAGLIRLLAAGTHQCQQSRCDKKFFHIKDY